MHNDDDRNKQKKTLVKYGKYGKKEKKIQTPKVSQKLASFFFMLFFALLFYCPKSPTVGRELKTCRFQLDSNTGSTQETPVPTGRIRRTLYGVHFAPVLGVIHRYYSKIMLIALLLFSPQVDQSLNTVV